MSWVTVVLAGGVRLSAPSELFGFDPPQEVVYEPDRMMGTVEIAGVLGIAPQTWRAYVAKGYAPAPDDPGDLSKAPRGRVPRWRAATVADYRLNRKRNGFRKG